MKLISIPVSPWSERAKFGLKVAGVELKKENVVNYTPLIDEYYLRWVTSKWNPFVKVSAPVLILENRVIEGSVEICKWASTQGSGSNPLIIPDDEFLKKLEDLCEIVLQAGRFRSCTRCAKEGTFDAKDIPAPFNRLPDIVTSKTSTLVFRYLCSKYAKPNQTYESSLEDMRTGLKQISELLKENGSKFFYQNKFSLADIIVASSISFSPLPLGHSNLGPNMEKQWVEPELVEEFKDLLEWRNAIYIERRGSPL